MNRLDFRYTNALERIAQNSPQNSIGGFISTNSVYTTDNLANNTGVGATDITVNNTHQSGYGAISGETFSFTSSSTVLSTTKRGIGTGVYPHLKDDAVFFISAKSLFDDDNSTLIQYRCICVKNISDKILDNVGIIISQTTTNDCQINAGIEVPLQDGISGVLTSVSSTITFTDSTLSNLYPDQTFAGSVVEMTSGDADGSYALINSYDKNGTFVLSSAIEGISVGDSYNIDPSPSQRVINGLTAPTSNAGLFSGFSTGEQIKIGKNLTRLSGYILRPNDIFYIWLSKTLTKNKSKSDDTSALILISYVNTSS